MADNKKATNVKTPRALGCFVYLAKPRPPMQPGGEAKYQLMLLWDKKTDLTGIRKAIEEAAVAKFGPGAVAALAKSKTFKNPLRDGDDKVAEDGGGEEFKGKFFMNATSTTRPAIIDTNNNPVDPNEVYSGCFFHAAVRFYAFDKAGNKGVGCGLQNLMLVSKGKRIDGRKSADQDFQDFKPEVLPTDTLDDAGADDLGDML